jgi:hypothetical protein
MTRKAELAFHDDLTLVWREPHAGDPGIALVLRRNASIAIIVSLLIHLLALLTLRMIPTKQGQEGDGGKSLPFSLVLNANAQAKESPKTLEPEAPAEEVPGPPAPPVVQRAPKRHVLTSRNANSTFSVPQVEPTPVPTPEPTPPPTPMPPVSIPGDMGAAIAARRAQREAAVHGDDYVAGGGPTSDQRRDEIIRNNLKPRGTNGVFTIISKGRYEASFVFNGWTNDYSNAHKQAFDVQAKAGEDINVVIVRKWISIIQQYYSGKFNWQSERRGTVELDATPGKEAALQAFLLSDLGW